MPNAHAIRANNQNRHIMPRPGNITFGILAGGIVAGLLLTARARAEPARAALIVGNATYSTLPGIPGCARSANTVAAALRALGFQVTERQDASTGGIDAGIAEFSQRLAGGGGAGFIYICGYGTDFNERTFLLPTTARIERPSDVLTQGLLVKSMLSSMSHDPATVGVVVFDLIPKPDAPAKIALDALTALPVPDGVAIVAATEAAQAATPTPLATAVVAALAGPEVRTDELLASVRTQLANSTLSIHAPARPGALAGPPPAVAPPTVAPKPPPPVTPAASAQSAAAAAVAPVKQLPDEAQMTEADRREVQSALVRLGYYGSPVDGLFGPETRAAIRRFQHEIGGEMTGRLAADQATRLVNTH
jgi:hypothetical protein